MLFFKKASVQAGLIVLLAIVLIVTILIQRQSNPGELSSQAEVKEESATDDLDHLGHDNAEVTIGEVSQVGKDPKPIAPADDHRLGQTINKVATTPAAPKPKLSEVTDPKIPGQAISKEPLISTTPKSAEVADPEISRKTASRAAIATPITVKSSNANDPRISRQVISKVKTREEAVELHRIITLRFLGQLEKFSSSTSNEVRMRRELEDTADRYYLLQKVSKMHKMKPLGAESLLESERKRVENLVTVLGYSSPAARAAEDAFSKFDLLNDEHIVHTLGKWLASAPAP